MNPPETVTAPGASATLYRDGPQWDGRRTATIGHWRCESDAAGTALLDRLAGTLKAEGFEALIGPMDGDTWHSYRLVLESDGSAPFLMEPVSQPQDIAAFRRAGFETISEYVSSRAALAATLGPEPVALPGVAITAWDGENAERLVGQLHEMSVVAFARNRFYKPLDRAGFLKLYEPLLPMIDPRFVLFAHAAGQLVGFLFGMPDRLAGPQTKTVVLKTYASGMKGVGHALGDAFHRRALGLGFDTVIHALMHVDNLSTDRSARHGATIFRRYGLMGRLL